MPRRPDDAIPPDELEEDESAALADLAGLAAQLGRDASDSAEEAATASAIFDRINRLSKDAQRRLFTRPAIRQLFDAAADRDDPPSADDPPGTVYYRTIGGEKVPWSKKPWTWADAWKMETETWIPERRMTLGFQGLMVTVHQRQRTTLPCVFYGIYQDAIRNEGLAEEHRDWLFMHGDGHLTDPSIVTEGGARSRGVNNHPRTAGYGNLCMPGGGVPNLEHVGDLDAERAGAR